ncbi:helix-turn-helix transcriptional regulator [Catenulispora pinisilvae]|nr:helix-turn-helix transcriptional regulator [Catenulispora pinisilvae]
MTGDLRSARLDAGLSQNELAVGLPVRGRAVSEWETGAVEPTLAHLMLLARALGRRLVVLGRDGEVLSGRLRVRAGEPWEVFERRRLAVPLRNRRLALGLSQQALGRCVGVSRDSIQRWELVRVPPRPIALIVWAQKLGYTVALERLDSFSRWAGTSDQFDRQLRDLINTLAAAQKGDHHVHQRGPLADSCEEAGGR